MTNQQPRLVVPASGVMSAERTAPLRPERLTRRRLAAFVVLLLTGVSLTSCGISVDEKQLDEAIKVIEQQSKDWQIELPQLEQQLAKDGSDLASQIGTEVAQLIQVSGQTVLATALCTIAYVRQGVIDTLKTIAWESFHSKDPRPNAPPSVCLTSPSQVDYESVIAGKATSLGFGGYNLQNSALPLSIEATDKSGGMTEVPENAFGANSPYLVTLNLSSTGWVPSPATAKIALMAGDAELSSVTVAGPTFNELDNVAFSWNNTAVEGSSISILASQFAIYILGTISEPKTTSILPQASPLLLSPKLARTSVTGHALRVCLAVGSIPGFGNSPVKLTTAFGITADVPDGSKYSFQSPAVTLSSIPPAIAPDACYTVQLP
jgi:hypothetical protein